MPIGWPPSPFVSSMRRRLDPRMRMLPERYQGTPYDITQPLTSGAQSNVFGLRGDEPQSIRMHGENAITAPNWIDLMRGGQGFDPMTKMYPTPSITAGTGMRPLPPRGMDPYQRRLMRGLRTNQWRDQNFDAYSGGRQRQRTGPHTELTVADPEFRPPIPGSLSQGGFGDLVRSGKMFPSGDFPRGQIYGQKELLSRRTGKPIYYGPDYEPPPPPDPMKLAELFKTMQQGRKLKTETDILSKPDSKTERVELDSLAEQEQYYLDMLKIADLPQEQINDAVRQLLKIRKERKARGEPVDMTPIEESIGEGGNPLGAIIGAFFGGNQRQQSTEPPKSQMSDEEIRERIRNMTPAERAEFDRKRQQGF